MPLLTELGGAERIYVTLDMALLTELSIGNKEEPRRSRQP
jgi:hypothetical protein